jgi:hypothetical protein
MQKSVVSKSVEDYFDRCRRGDDVQRGDVNDEVEPARLELRKERNQIAKVNSEGQTEQLRQMKSDDLARVDSELLHT